MHACRRTQDMTYGRCHNSAKREFHYFSRCATRYRALYGKCKWSKKRSGSLGGKIDLETKNKKMINSRTRLKYGTFFFYE